MDVDSVECLSLPDAAMDAADDVGLATLHPHLAASSRAAPFPNPKGGGGGAGGMVAPGSSVHELLECPVCTNSMYPPIHQCQNGHTLCSTCKARVHNRCPTCRQELGDIRCLALEKVAESLELPCKYYTLGCPEISSHTTAR
ncbi:hypothetical protein ACQ4PT_069322 [Festuca glaucescens]